MHFSVSPAVRDLSVSSSFYEQLGFAVIAGEPSEHWLILANGEAKIGLFQG
jgi:predicted lactoylglutathione lyase